MVAPNRQLGNVAWSALGGSRIGKRAPTVASKGTAARKCARQAKTTVNTGGDESAPLSPRAIARRLKEVETDSDEEPQKMPPPPPKTAKQKALQALRAKQADKAKRSAYWHGESLESKFGVEKPGFLVWKCEHCAYAVEKLLLVDPKDRERAKTNFRQLKNKHYQRYHPKDQKV